MKKIGKFLKSEFVDDWTPFQAALLGIVVTLIVTLAVLPLTSRGEPINGTVLMALFASGIGFLGTVQGARQKSTIFLCGATSSVLMAILSFGPYQNLGNGIYQVALGIPMQLLGFYMWISKRDSKGNVLPKNISLKGVMTLLLTFSTIYLIYAFTVPKREGATEAQHWIDALVLVAMVLSNLIMMCRYTEHWYFWLGANLVNIGLYTAMIVGLSNGTADYGKDVTVESCVISMIQFVANEVTVIYAIYFWKKSAKNSEKYQLQILSKDELKQLHAWPKTKYQFDKFFTKH